MKDRISKLFEEFVGFPSKYSIVRNAQKNDAFNIYVFEILFNPFHRVSKFIHKDSIHREILKTSIVPPPDDFIDIFYEEDDLDEKQYHIVQVKNSKLGQSDIETCFKMMEHSIDLYLKKPNEVKKTLRNIISETDFGKQYKKNCHFYVVHSGHTNYIRNQKKNYTIVTTEQLNLLREGNKLESVPHEKFTIDKASNFIVNNFIEEKDKKSRRDINLPKSLLCNFNGYDLAVLNNKYSNTILGRNILYGQNLRESLSKTSKTYSSMFKTIDKEPELFLFYNNGITVLSKSLNAKEIENKENILLKEFSIINGAQTTSTLGAYLKEAEIEGDLEKIENLKNVYVLTKIYEINPKLPNHEEISENIKIFTNTQTPLSSRDMVSIRKEQIKLQRRFLEDFDSPNAFIYIKKGEKVIDYPKTAKYQQITNEKLAQLVYCGFFRSPHTAKDKKSKLFDNDLTDDYTLNKFYHNVFDLEDGILFKKSNIELDELLFIYRIHEDTKIFHKRSLKESIQKLSTTPSINDTDKKTKESRVNRAKRQMEISNVCLFFNICAYYTLKELFDQSVENSENKIFDTKRYYADKSFKESIIKDFLELIYSTTVSIIADNSGIDNTTNWIRSEKNETLFLEKLDDEILGKEFSYSEKYIEFSNKYRNVGA